MAGCYPGDRAGTCGSCKWFIQIVPVGDTPAQADGICIIDTTGAAVTVARTDGCKSWKRWPDENGAE